MNKSKFTYPKCPYCKSVYEERLGSMNYALLDLARFGSKTNAKVKCDKCNHYFNVSIHITYYGSKLKGEWRRTERIEVQPWLIVIFASIKIKKVIV